MDDNEIVGLGTKLVFLNEIGQEEEFEVTKCGMFLKDGVYCFGFYLGDGFCDSEMLKELINNGDMWVNGKAEVAKKLREMWEKIKKSRGSET